MSAYTWRAVGCVAIVLAVYPSEKNSQGLQEVDDTFGLNEQQA